MFEELQENNKSIENFQEILKTNYVPNIKKCDLHHFESMMNMLLSPESRNDSSES